MVGPHSKTLLAAGLALAAAGAVALGLQLRLEDPLSTPVIPAEDPYTHMALVREHLRDGTLDPLNEPGSLYPPGMHALVAAVVVYTGEDLYDVMRAGPAVLGALGLAGLAILVARFESLGAAVAATLALAIAPEAIFRTAMMSPTAVDLALIPFLAYAFLELLQGRLAWAAPAAALSAFLLFSHPWVFGVLAVAGLAVVLLATVLPWPAERGPLPTAWGLVATVAIAGTGLALALTGCWGGCGPGFRDVLGPGSAGAVDLLARAVLALSLLPLGVKAVRPRAFRGMFPAERRPPGLAARIVASQVLLAGAVAFYFVAKRGGWPPHVDPMVMFGWPILVAAALGLAALPFRPTPAGHVGAGLALGTLPFVLLDPFDSPFWSHRTAVYLGLGLAILCGVAVAALARAAIAVARRLATAAPAQPLPAGAPGPAPAPRANLLPLLAVTGLLALAALGGGAYAATPGQYPGGWYRLYSECEFDGLQEVSALAQAEPRMLVVTGDWQSKLVLSGLTDDASRIWYKPDFFTSPTERGNVVRMLEEQGRPILVVHDRLVAQEHPEIDAAFLQSPPWTPVDTWCEGDRALSAYTVER